MAEEILVKEDLSAEMVRGGAELLAQLDQGDWPVIGAFWNFEAQYNRWRLMIVSPRVDAEGPLKAYQTVGAALDKLQRPVSDRMLWNITVISPRDPIVAGLEKTASILGSIEGRRFKQQVMGRAYIDDVYVYRVAPASTAA